MYISNFLDLFLPQTEQSVSPHPGQKLEGELFKADDAEWAVILPEMEGGSAMNSYSGGASFRTIFSAWVLDTAFNSSDCLMVVKSVEAAVAFNWGFSISGLPSLNDECA